VAQLLKGRVLGETKKAKRIAMEGLAFKSVAHESRGKSFADARSLRPVEVPASALWNRAQPLQFGPVCGPKLILRQISRVVNSAENDESADLETSRQASEFIGQRCAGLVFITDGPERNENLGCHLVTPYLDPVRRGTYRFHVGKSGLTNPKVSQLVSEGEHLRRFRIRSVDKDERSKTVRKGKTPKLLGVKFAVVVTADHAVHHDQNAEFVRLFRELTKGFFPGAHAAASRNVETESLADALGNGLDGLSHVRRTDERTSVLSHRSGVVAVPLLPLLANVDCFQQIGTRMADIRITHRPEVRNGHLIDRRLL